MVTGKDRPWALREKGTVAGAAGPTTHIQPSLGCERASLYLFSLVLPTYVCNLPLSRFSYPTNRQQATASILPPLPPLPRGRSKAKNRFRRTRESSARSGSGTGEGQRGGTAHASPSPFPLPTVVRRARSRCATVRAFVCCIDGIYPSRNRRFLCLLPATKTLVP